MHLLETAFLLMMFVIIEFVNKNNAQFKWVNLFGFIKVVSHVLAKVIKLVLNLNRLFCGGTYLSVQYIV